MNTNEAAKAWDDMIAFLACDEDLSDEDLLRDLKQAGVDTDSFMARIGVTVRRGIQAQRRRQAVEERANVGERLSEIRERVIRFPIETVRQITRDAEQGKFGAAGQELAIACRNKQDTEPTEEELRALTEDILMIAEEQDGDHEKNPQR